MPTPKIDPKVIFASEAPAQDTPAVFTNKTVGWGESRKNGGRPTIKEFNALQQDTDLKILWLNENSVTPYAPEIDYPINAVTLKDGSFKIFNGSIWSLFLDKSSVGLGNVDNTSDANKPISSATQSSLDLKADKYGYRWTYGTAGQESAINTITGYEDNGIAANIRGAHVQQGSRNNENIIGGDASTVGVDTPNVVDTSKIYNAHYAIVGGYDNVNNVLAGIVIGYHCKALDDGTGSAGATHATIFGGSYHEFIDGDYAACVGGTANKLDHKTGGAYSFFGAGHTGQIYAKFSAIVASYRGRIGTAGVEKEYSGIYNSNLSTIDGNYAVVIAGNECKSTKDYSQSSGKSAVANNVGERAFSTGKFVTAGDSGQSVLHLMRQTTDGVQTQLLCSDGTTGNAITALGQNTSLVIKGLISAYNVTSNSTASFEITAHITRIGAANVAVDALTVTPIFNPESLALPSVVGSTSLFQVRVTGLVANTIRWTCKLDQVWSRSL